MSELTARLAIYGSIDAAVVEQTVDLDRVIRYLPTYESSEVTSLRGAAGWYEDLRTLGGADESSAPFDDADLAAALEQLGDTPLTGPLDAEHRLRALFLARRIFDRWDDGTEELLLSALRPVVEFSFDGGTASGADELGRAERSSEDPTELARELLALMDEAEPTDVDDGYPPMAGKAARRSLCAAIVAELARVPCTESTRRFTLPGGTDVDVAAVVTSEVKMEVAKATVEQLRLRFHPGNWPNCLPLFWKKMDPIEPFPPGGVLSPTTDPGTAKFFYREHVGDQVNKSEWFSPVLEFWYDALTGQFPNPPDVNGFSIHYGLPATLPPGVDQDERILLDDGDLTVVVTDLKADPMEVHVLMLKELAMRPPLPSAGLAIFACASGWLDQAKALVAGCFSAPPPGR